MISNNLIFRTISKFSVNSILLNEKKSLKIRNLYHDKGHITKIINKNLLSSNLTTLSTTSITTSSNVAKSFRLAIIGSGPAGFYTAYRLLKDKNFCQSNLMMIDMYEALPMPFGLVRYGVAPDHQDVKVHTHF
jgi:hypothetical protein